MPHTASTFPALLPRCLLLFLSNYIFPGSMFLNSGFSCLRLSSPKCRSTPRKHPACLRHAGTGIFILSMSIILLQNTCTRILVQSTALRIEKGYLVLCGIFFLPCEVHWSKTSLGLQFPAWLLDAALACEWLTRLSSCSMFASAVKQQRTDQV